MMRMNDLILRHKTEGGSRMGNMLEILIELAIRVATYYLADNSVHMLLNHLNIDIDPTWVNFIINETKDLLKKIAKKFFDKSE
jgi:hypothetical protein